MKLMVRIICESTTQSFVSRSFQQTLVLRASATVTFCKWLIHDTGVFHSGLSYNPYYRIECYMMIMSDLSNLQLHQFSYDVIDSGDDWQNCKFLTRCYLLLEGAHLRDVLLQGVGLSYTGLSKSASNYASALVNTAMVLGVRDTSLGR